MLSLAAALLLGERFDPAVPRQLLAGLPVVALVAAALPLRGWCTRMALDHQGASQGARLRVEEEASQLRTYRAT
jgi:hypothetical protein